MNVRKIWLIIILMSAALAGIVLVQAYWINNAITLRKTIFDQQVNEALYTVVSKLETQQTANALAERFDILRFESYEFSRLDSLFSGEELLSDTMLSQVLEYIPDQEGVGASDGVISGGMGSGAFPGSEDPTRFVLDPFAFESSVLDVGEMDDSRLLPMLLRDVEDQIILNVNRFNQVMKQMLVETVQKGYTAEQRIDTELLDSLLYAELAGKGIQADYHYGVLIDRDKLLTTAEESNDRERLIRSDHRVALHPNSIYPRNDQLMVIFPREGQLVLGSIWSLLTGSLLFTLIIVFSFAYTVWVIFRQKKISDIKTDFINNMTHEFKTPIATINLAVDSMNNPMVAEDKERILRYAKIISEENNRMNAQVEKVLQMAMLDRNQIKLTGESVDVHHLVSAAIDTIQLQVEKREGKLESKLEADRTEVKADEVHLLNALCNLLDNANKYSPEQPHITVKTWNERDNICVSIADSGMGMSRETQKHIFEKFYRVPKGDLHDVKGFGLGLSYVKAIVDAHDGHVRVKSQPGKGSTFTLLFPLNR